MGTHIAGAIVAGFVGGALGRAFDDVPDATLGEINEWISGYDILMGLVEYRFRHPWGGKRREASHRPGGILALWDAEAIVTAVTGLFDVSWMELRNFEGAEPDVAVELDDEIVAGVYLASGVSMSYINETPTASQINWRICHPRHRGVGVRNCLSGQFKYD